MIESTAHITADNLRADYINATTNWERWKLFNSALDWAVTARQNADAARKAVQEMERDKERDCGEVPLPSLPRFVLQRRDTVTTDSSTTPDFPVGPAPASK